MREIKFRIFINGEFHYWGFIERHGHLGFNGVPMQTGMTFEEIQEKSEQFTNRLDETGKSVYEGDNLQSQEDFGDGQYSDIRTVDHGVVEFHGGAFYPVCEHPDKYFKIIGNVHEEEPK